MEQLKHEHDILFDQVSTTLPTKYSDTALTAEDEHRPNQTDITNKTVSTAIIRC